MNSDSIESLEQFLKLQKSLHGPRSTEAARVVGRMAQAYCTRKDYRTAERLFNQALQILREHAKPSQTIIREFMSQLAEIERLQNSPPDDLQDDMQWLRVSTDRLPAFTPESHLHLPPEPAEHTEPREAGANTPSPKACPAGGVSDRAIADAKLHVHKLQQATGHDTKEVADALRKLADLYARREQLDEMEPLLIEALRIRETVCGEQHLNVSTDLKNLGRLYYFKRDYAKADALLARARAIREKALGRDHSLVADVVEWQARVMRKTFRLSEAEQAEAFVAISRERNKSDWDKFKDLGEKLYDEGMLLESQAMWMAALEECADFRFDDPRLSLTLENLAEIYWRRRKFDKAEPLCKQILQIVETLLGPDHPDVGMAANNLAILCEKQGKHAEAAILYQQALAITQNWMPADSDEIKTMRESHARARNAAQRQVEQKLEDSRNGGRWTKSGWWKAYAE